MGLLSTIAFALGYDLIDIQVATDSTRIDLEACIAIKMIIREGECYCLILTPLPDLVHITIHV